MSEPTPSDQAWSVYLQAIDAARTTALGWRWAQTPQMRAQALYFISMMQAFGFNTNSLPGSKQWQLRSLRNNGCPGTRLA